MTYGAVIAAAGMSTRMKDFKQLIKVGDMTFAERIIVNFQRAGVKNIVMIVGFRGDEVKKSLRKCGVTFLENPDYERTDMFESVKTGLSYLAGTCDGIFVSPVDVPFFKETTIAAEIQAIEREEDKADIVIPHFGESSGHPILLSSRAADYIRTYCGPGGLRAACGAFLAEKNEKVRVVMTEDEGCTIDADTPEDLERIIAFHNAHVIRPKVKVMIAGARPFFGPGAVTLLRQIDILGNVREACKKTEMSYSKGWSLISACEEALGVKIVERTKGGTSGGRAEVTEAGRRLIGLYEQFDRDVNAMAEQRFKELFTDEIYRD